MEKPPKNPILINARFMGEYSITVNERSVDGFSTLKTRALLAYMFLEKESEHSRSRLAGFFWPDVSESAALHNLRQALSLIRKSFIDAGYNDDLFFGSRDTVRLNPGIEVRVDSQEIEIELASLVRNGHPFNERGFPVRRLARVLGGYRGQLLTSLHLDDSCPFDEWLILKREGLDQLVMEGAAWLLAYHEKRGDWTAARTTAEMLTRICPWDEDLHYRHIRSLLYLQQANAARSQYRAMERYLRNEINASPSSRLQGLSEEIENAVTRGVYPETKLTRQLILPQYSTPFIGREHELEILENWITDTSCRVVSLTGTSGSGKTRLACQLALDQHTLFKDGVHFITVTGIEDLTRLAQTILHAISGEAEHKSDVLVDLTAWLQHRRVLLILDGVEVVSLVGSLVAELLKNAPHAAFLLTTYQPLGLIGERVLPVGGLEYEKGKDPLTDPPAVKLFYCHLQKESQPRLQDEVFKARATEICRLVEGLPLAIDLAASQARNIPIETIIERLHSGLEVLSSTAPNLPERQQSVEACFNLAWDNLGEEQRQMLRSLTIFKSPYSNAAALAVCGVGSEVHADFIDRSLVIAMSGGRYRFHILLQRYVTGRSPFTDSEKLTLEGKYCAWFVKRLEESYRDRQGRKLVDFLREADRVIADLVNTARLLICRSDWDGLERLIPPLYGFYESRGLYREGSLVFIDLVKRCPLEEEALRCRIMLHTRAGILSLRIQQYSTAYDLLQTSLDLSRQTGDKGEEVMSLLGLSTYTALQKKASDAALYAREGLTLAKEIGDEDLQSQAYYDMAYAEDNAGNIRQSLDHLQRSRLLSEKLGDWRRLSKVVTQLGDAACSLGEYEKAISYYRDALYYAEELQNTYTQALITNNLGTAYMVLQRYKEAREAFNQSVKDCQTIGDREGESIALCNMGEIDYETGDYERALRCVLKSLEIAVEVGSGWAEMSARSMMAQIYLALDQVDLSLEHTLSLMDLSEVSEAMYFLQYSLYIGCALLIKTKKPQGTAEILKLIHDSEDTDDYLRGKVSAFQAELTDPIKGTIPKDFGEAAFQLRTLLDTFKIH